MLRRSLGHHGAAARTALRTQIDDMVGAFDNVKVVLDDEHRVSLIHKTLKHHELLPHILEMQSGSGLVQYIERFARLTTMQLACQFHALSLAAGKRGSRLP